MKAVLFITTDTDAHNAFGLALFIELDIYKLWDVIYIISIVKPFTETILFTIEIVSNSDLNSHVPQFKINT